MPPRRISFSEVGRQNIVSSDEQTTTKNTLKTTEAGLLRLDPLRRNRPTRRRQRKDQIRRCNIAFASYKEIPKEIWMYIFELYCQSDWLSTCITAQPRVVIMQVCSAWRQIALSMPKLWSDVHLCKDVNIASLWLGRAGNVPRALETSRPPSHWHHCPSPNQPQTIQGFICSFPFRKLHLTECDAVGIDFMGIPVESLLLLEDLALLEPARNSADLGAISLSPHHFPNLVSLRIDMNNMPRFHIPRPFGTWKKLRILRLECFLDKAECFKILRGASSVKDCSFRLSLTPFYGNSQDSTIENVVLANLKILRLSFPFTFASWPFLNHITLPNLHTLILISRDSCDFQPHDKLSLLRFASRIGSLRSLTFHHSYKNVDVGFILECLPLLQVLELHCGKITTDTAEKIGRGELGGCLRELCDWSASNLYEFLQACELRRDITQGQSTNDSGTIVGLEKVSVRYSKSCDVTDCKRRIRKLFKDGIQFEVFRGSSRV